MVLLQMNPQKQEATDRKLHETQVENYDFTMFWSRITTSHGIAVKWYLRVYWLLPFSIVASFKKNRRFFCLAPTILLESTDDSFAEHHEYLGQSINFISKRSHFLLSPDSFSLHQLNQQTAWQKSYYINRHLPQDPPVFFVDKTFISNILNPGNCRAVPGYVLALLKDGHQWDGVSSLTGILQERKR